MLTPATAGLGARARPLVGGAAYGDALGGAVWIFAILGTLFALAQLLLYSGIAASDRVAAVAVWCAVAVEAIGVEVMAYRGELTVLTVVGIAVAASVLLVGAGLIRLWRAHAAPPVPAGNPAAA